MNDLSGYAFTARLEILSGDRHWTGLLREREPTRDVLTRLIVDFIADPAPRARA